MTTTVMPLMQGGHAVPVVFEDTANSQVVAVGASSASSSAIDSSNDRVIGLVANTDCWYAIGTSPTAAADTAGSVFLPSGAKIYIGIKKAHVVAVIQDAAGGQLSIVPAEAI